MEASQNKIGSPVDKLMLFCSDYDPKTGKYGLVIMRMLQVCGIATVIVLGSFITIMIRRDKRRSLRMLKQAG